MADDDKWWESGRDAYDGAKDARSQRAIGAVVGHRPTASSASSAAVASPATGSGSAFMSPGPAPSGSSGSSGAGTPSAAPRPSQSSGDMDGSPADDSESDSGDFWMEAVLSASGAKVWINERTREASFDPPPGSNTESSGVAAGLEPMNELKARRNSNILGSTLSDDALPRHMRGGTQALVSAQSTGSLLSDAGDGAVEDAVVPVAAGGQIARPVIVVAQPLVLLSSMRKYVEQLTMMADVPDSARSPLEDIRTKLEMVEQMVDEEINRRDDRSNVEALVDFEHLPWKFDSPSDVNRPRSAVDAYRARAARFQHDQFAYKESHMPQYLSSAPLPNRNGASVHMHVRLPLQSPDQSLQQTRVAVHESEMVEMVLTRALAQHNRAVQNPAQRLLNPAEEYVFKAEGLNEYLVPGRRVLDYAFVRACVRDGIDVHVHLMPRPPVPPPDPASAARGKEVAAAYVAKVPPGTKVLSVDENTVSNANVPWDQIRVFSMREMNAPFQVRIGGLEDARPEGLPRLDANIQFLEIRTFLYHGTFQLPNSAGATSRESSSPSTRFNQYARGVSQITPQIKDLPRETRICFLLYGSYGQQDERGLLLGYVCDQLVDVYGQMVQGPRTYRLWPLRVEDKEGDLGFLMLATTVDNRCSAHAAQLSVMFDQYTKPVVAPLTTFALSDAAGGGGARPVRVGSAGPAGAIPIPQGRDVANKGDVAKARELMKRDPLAKFSDQEVGLVYACRDSLIDQPQGLPHFLACVDWTREASRNEAYRLLSVWTTTNDHVVALQLLGPRFADYNVRRYAVEQLRRARDWELQPFLLELTQCIKFEPYHDSPLVRFLIERALASPFEIGHYFFWHIKAEMANPDFCERFALILEEYVTFAGEFAVELRKQSQAVTRLQRVAELVVKYKVEHKYTDEQCTELYVKELEKLNANFFSKIGSFQLPLNPHQEVRQLVVEKCRFMSSKKVPLWLVFQSADASAPEVYTIFKSGDDLRQDILTLQLLRMMDNIWLERDLNTCLRPYRCIATGVNDEGEGVGMIEVVLKSDTTSGIQIKYGGGATGAMKLDPLDRFIRNHNKTDDMYNAAVDRFLRSCAGYCVATFVLGIGDRHNGNIMLTKDGHLFHIDFGHFLGNFKKKFGFNRERAPFVFTPEMAFVIGGKQYKKSEKFGDFKNLCSKLFIALRSNAHRVESMFMLMVSAGMPELSSFEDIEYCRDKLLLDRSDTDADKAFRKEVQNSLDSTWRRIDNLIHNLKHG